LINRQIATLQNGVNHGKSHKIKRGMAYKLFGAVVRYDQAYQGMQEVVLDSEMLEATAQVKFQTTEENGNFNVGPYWIDSLGHVAGFIMNANENTDPSLQVFVNHGWDRMRCTKAFSPERTYQVYNRMQNIGGTLHSGDTYILEDANVIAVFEGVKVSCTSPSPNIILTVNSSKECLAPCSIICSHLRARVRAICQPSRSPNRQISPEVRG
jgi:naphtho-gamma-pyrone polyketide synthase